jgi:hypothetical protein
MSDRVELPLVEAELLDEILASKVGDEISIVGCNEKKVGSLAAVVVLRESSPEFGVSARLRTDHDQEFTVCVKYGLDGKINETKLWIEGSDAVTSRLLFDRGGKTYVESLRRYLGRDEEAKRVTLQTIKEDILRLELETKTLEREIARVEDTREAEIRALEMRILELSGEIALRLRTKIECERENDGKFWQSAKDEALCANDWKERVSE